MFDDLLTKYSQEQLIAIHEENEGLLKERSELHLLLNDTAQELDQKKKDLAEAEGELGSLAAAAKHLSSTIPMLNCVLCVTLMAQTCWKRPLLS